MKLRTKKQTIQELEHVLAHLTHNTKDEIAKYCAIAIYNTLMFSFDVSEKRLNKILTKN